MIYSGRSVVAEYHLFLILDDFCDLGLHETKKALPKQSLYRFYQYNVEIELQLPNFR